MKIAHLVSTFPPRVGGMGNVCQKEAELLSAEHEVVVFTLDYGQSNENESALPYKIVRKKSFCHFGNGGFVFNLKKDLAGFDLVHLHYPFYGALGNLIRAKKILGFPLVATYHMDPQAHGLLKILHNFFDALYSRRLFSLADRVIAVDLDYYKQSKYGKRLGKEKVKIIANGVDLNIFSPGPKDWAAVGHPEFAGKPIVLFVGNFLSVKNLPFLIEILPSLPKDVILFAVGGGYDEEKLRQLVKNTEYEKRIVFSGRHFNEKELNICFRSADITAVPSFSESFSLVTVGALASGGIVAASDIAGIRARIEQNTNGFLFPVNDSEAWINGLNKILNLPVQEKQKISIRAVEFAQKYSLSEHLKNLLEVYREVKN